MTPLAMLPIAVLADRTGVAIDTIRSYERLGFIARPRQARNGLLLYPPEEIERVAFVKRALELDFPVNTIREMLGIGRGKAMTCSEVHAIAERHLADVRRRLADLAHIERVLTPMVQACPRRGGLADCPVVNSLSHPAPSP